VGGLKVLLGEQVVVAGVEPGLFDGVTCEGADRVEAISE
jgi:hypothetical protein